MTRKQIVVIVSIVLVVLATASVVVWQRASGGDHAHEAGEIYYCPMHPTVTSDRPGSCPICGMKLVRRASLPQSKTAAQLAEDGKLAGSQATLAVSPAQQVMANVRTVRVVSGMDGTELITTGRVTFDERRVAQVTSYTAGRIEQLYANFTGDTVRRGSAVATIYSPDLYGTQRELIVAIENGERISSHSPQAIRSAGELVESSRTRLLLMGMSPAQITQLVADRKPVYATTIISPVSGIVTQKFVVRQQYVMAGQPLVEVADLTTVWVEADVFEQQLPDVRIGQRVSISSPSLPGRELPGAVAFIQPVLSGETRSANVRIELPNPDLQLKPDMFVTVKFSREARPAGLSVPPGAIIDRGQQQFVWVETAPGTFALRVVQVGARSSDRVEILSGLTEGENVVAEGAFLLDSEAQLQSPHGGH